MPPISTVSSSNFTIIPVQVNISIILLNIVSLVEVSHIIELKFSIVLQWRENRAMYHNPKMESSLNKLSDDDINKLWLPLVIYQNTDQEEITRLGDTTE